MDFFDYPPTDNDARKRIETLENAHDELVLIVYELKEKIKLLEQDDEQTN